MSEKVIAIAGVTGAVGTEMHLANRLAKTVPDKTVRSLAGIQCLCTTMYRIDLAHLCWSLANMAAGPPVNVIDVDEETARWSLLALQRMLEVS